MPNVSELEDLRRVHAGIVTLLQQYQEVRSRPWMQKPHEQETTKKDALRTVSSAAAVRSLQDKVTAAAMHTIGMPVVRTEHDALRNDVAVLRAGLRTLLPIAAASSGSKAVGKLDALARAALAQRDAPGLAALLLDGPQTVRDGFGAGPAEEAVAVLASIIADGPPAVAEAFRKKAEADAGASILLEDLAAAAYAIENDLPSVTIRAWGDRGEPVTVDIRNVPQREPAAALAGV
jgi:hypothetical protein